MGDSVPVRQLDLSKSKTTTGRSASESSNATRTSDSTRTTDTTPLVNNQSGASSVSNSVTNELRERRIASLAKARQAKKEKRENVGKQVDEQYTGSSSTDSTTNSESIMELDNSTLDDVSGDDSASDIHDVVDNNSGPSVRGSKNHKRKRTSSTNERGRPVKRHRSNNSRSGSVENTKGNSILHSVWHETSNMFRLFVATGVVSLFYTIVTKGGGAVAEYVKGGDSAYDEHIWLK